MRYYQCEQYPIEFVVSENMEKHFVSHNHVRHYVISVVIQGTALVSLKNKEAVYRKGDVFIVPPYEVHAVRQGRDTRLLSMCTGTAFIEKNDLKTAEEIVQTLLEDAEAQGIFEAEQREKLFSSMKMVYCLRDRKRREMDADIKTLAEKMTGYPEQELPLETLAAELFVSKYYFIRKFKKSVGMTPHQFCIQNRIRKSQGMLDGKRTISEIAVEMGFYDQSHFDRAFRRIVGISPSEYADSKIRMGQGRPDNFLQDLTAF